MQIEANMTGARDSGSNRRRFAEATATVLDRYLSAFWDVGLVPSTP